MTRQSPYLGRKDACFSFVVLVTMILSSDYLGNINFEKIYVSDGSDTDQMNNAFN